MITLVLLPGMDGTGELFEPFVAALGREFNVIVVRYPNAEPLAYVELEALARSSLPVDGPFVILGESFSGPIAVSLAASASPQLKGLVLCCSFVRSPRPLFSSLRSVLALLPIGAAPIGVLSRVLLGSFSNDQLRCALARAMSQVSPATLRARLRAVLSVDVSTQLTKSRVPVLYLRASRDWVVPRSASELICRLVPGARVVELEAPHFLLQAMPTEAAQVVGAFVREVQIVA